MFDSGVPEWRLDLDAVARYPRPGMTVPGAFAFSPDSRLLTYLFSDQGDLTRDLWVLDCESGERSLLVRPPGHDVAAQSFTPQETLRRERLRQRESGITQYTWAKSADRILVPYAGRLYITNSAGESLREIATDEAPLGDARLAPDGSRVVFVRDAALWSADLESDVAVRLSPQAEGALSYGVAEFIAQEEMGRSDGFWISPDSRLVAYTRVDETAVDEYPIVHQGDTTWSVEQHRYPFAGRNNARVSLGLVSILGGPTLWLDLDLEERYLARVDWSPPGGLYAQIESRDQRRLELWRIDPRSRTTQLVLVDEQEPWINLHDDLRFVGNSEQFIWSAERGGFRHISLHDADGRLIRMLTAGAWAVDRVAHVDSSRGLVFYLSGRESPIERHLYSVPLNGGESHRLSQEPGMHAASFSPDGRSYVHQHDNRFHSPTIMVEHTDGERPIELHGGMPIEALMPGARPPEIVEIPSRDSTQLFGAVYTPAQQDQRLPVVVSVYGGPHAQTVTNSWSMTVDLRAQYLASRGFVVFKLDNRGSARRGLFFEAALHLHMGSVEVEDQVDGIRWLIDQGIADPARIGIYGWSYGGYMTLMCLLKAPELFRCGVAGAPVTDWDGYDTHYTERYMSTPQINPGGYHEASAIEHAAALRGDLLLIHGMIDENVHFRHTARFISALERCGRPFDLVIFPEERHMPRDAAGLRFLEQRVVYYFERTLLGSDDRR